MKNSTRMTTLPHRHIMTIGEVTDGRMILTRSVVENSIHGFDNAPILLNEKVIGFVRENTATIEGDKVFADLLIFDEFDKVCDTSFFWGIQFSEDKTSFCLLNLVLFLPHV